MGDHGMEKKGGGADWGILVVEIDYPLWRPLGSNWR